MITEDEWQWTHSDGISLWPGELKKQIRKVHLQLAFIFTKTLHVYCLTIYMYSIVYEILDIVCFYTRHFSVFICITFLEWNFTVLYFNISSFTTLTCCMVTLNISLYYTYLFVIHHYDLVVWWHYHFDLGCIVTLNIGPSDILIRHVH